YWPDLPEDYYSLDNETRQNRIWAEAVEKTIAYNNEIIDTLALADLVPRMYELSSDHSVEVYDFAQKGCSNFTIAGDGVSRGFTSILSLNLLDEEFSVDADHIVSNWSTVYASKDTMIIAEPAQNWWWYWGNEKYDEATNIHRFALSSDGTALYTGSGRIEGTVENQFSLSAFEGSLRVASTTGQWNRWWMENPTPPENHVYVLQQGDNNTLNTVGHIGGIAKGEKIWSARFIGTKGYLVTFRNMDPLWTEDVSDPTKPVIAGKLDVPGVSTYIYPLSETRLLTIGYGGDETGLNWSIEVSLFNVADFAQPALVDHLSLFANTSDNTTSSWGWSEAIYEHKAFQYWEPKKILAVPLSSYRYTYKNEYDYFYEYMSKLTLLNVDNETGFSLHGSVDHSAFYNSDTSMYWCSQDIRRSIFMGDYIYAISDRGITANTIDNLTSTASRDLPGSDCGGYVY
ncbi:MAG: beta-propeller domain-containing protein, partial [Pseudomonadota bacterium]